MPIVSLLLSHILAHSFISLLLERAVSLPVSHRRLSSSLLHRSSPPLPPPPLSNRRTESYSSFRDRDASAVILEQGAVMLSNPGRRAREFWQADFCAGNASRITMALSYLNLVDVVGYVKVAAFRELSSMSRTNN